MKILFDISTLIFGFSALLLIVERYYTGIVDETSYDNEIYFVITTVSTVGYGNETVSSASKFICTIIVILGIIIVPSNCAQLMELISSESMYVRRRYKIFQNTSFIIITGSISDIAATDFLNEYFHADHGDQNRHCLILQNQRPEGNLENIISNQLHNQQVFYLQGDSLNEKDLKRCQAEKAKAIVLLCNKQSADPNQEDSKTILQAMVIKKYLKSSSAKNVKICMQLLRPEGKAHYYLSLNKQSNSDQVICVEELKLSLLAKSCLCPGLMAFFTNLITSSGDLPNRSEIEYDWLYEYWQGKGFEIYKAQLSTWFTGKSFSLTSAIIYDEFKAIIFALEITNDETSKIFTNPGQFIIPEHYKITVYCIAEDKTTSDRISSFKLSDIDLQNRTNKIYQNTMNKKMSISDEDQDDDDQEEDQQQNDSVLELKLKNDNLNFIGERRKIEENFHITHNKIQLSDVTFKTMEKNILATNHIIVCGLVPNLINFIFPLRAKNLNRYPPIVILHDKKPIEKQWSQIAYFPEIYFIKGSAMKEKDIYKTNIHKAQKVVILSPNVDEVKLNKFVRKVKQDDMTGNLIFDYKNLTRDQEDLLDARTIFKYKAIIKIRPNIPIVTEMVCPQNLQFLQPNPNDYALMKKHHYALTPNFASGEIFLSSTLDTLICQSYYNPSLISILNHLLIGNTTNQQKNDDFSEVKTSNLYHLPVPYSFYGQTFEKLFKYLIKKQNILSLGLYRLPGCKDNRFPYIVTNPDPYTILTDKDMVFILAQKMPSLNSREWGAPLEINLKQNTNTYVENNQYQEDLINIEDKLDIESKKIKKLFEENKVVCSKIRNLVSELKNLKEFNNDLIIQLKNRESKILQNIQHELHKEMLELIPVQQNNVIKYNDEQMITASSATSISSQNQLSSSESSQINNFNSEDSDNS